MKREDMEALSIIFQTETCLQKDWEGRLRWYFLQDKLFVGFGIEEGALLIFNELKEFMDWLPISLALPIEISSGPHILVYSFMIATKPNNSNFASPPTNS